MNAQRLLQHYERIADAPDAIARLRRFILDLAVRGRLVPQHANDESVLSVLRSGRIASTPQGPFALPPSWAWVNVGAVADARLGKMLDKGKNKGTPRPYLRNINVRWFDFDLSDLSEMRFEDSELPEFELRSGDVLICEGGEPGRAAVWDGREKNIYFQKAIHRVRFSTAVDSSYFVRALRASADDGRLTEYFTGTGIKHFTGKGLDSYLFPLPPFAEQQRIVAKVDELMGLCDRLEAARASREVARDRLAAARLARLNAPDPGTFQADARFALDALPALTTRPNQIKALRQTILNLAGRGKLVPQDANDEPASELLKRIALERDELVRSRQIRLEDRLSPVQSFEMPFEIPQKWIWSRIGEAVLFTQYGTSEKSNPSETGVPVLTMGNVQDGLVVWSNEKRIPTTSEDLPALYLRKFDLLYNRTNSAELVGKTGIYLGEDGMRTFASYLIRLRPSLRSSDPRFLNMAMNTPDFRRTQITPHIKKQTGQANVNGTALKNMLVPLPPLAEQCRIVAKVAELMTLCDRLEANLSATAATRRRLLDALLAEALAPKAAFEVAA